MNIQGLLPHQPPHVEKLMRSLVRWGSALDASDTGTGKTFAALAICRELGITPLVLGPKNSKTTWERAGHQMDVDVEWINYERVRGRRQLRGGKEYDAVMVCENRLRDTANPCHVTCYRNGKSVFQRTCDWWEVMQLVPVGTPAYTFGSWDFEEPRMVGQEKTAESDWVEEHKYGSGSFLKWKEPVTMAIFDEVHRCGGSTTLNSKLLIAARRQFKFNLCLSATAADNPMQMKALGFTLGLHKLSDKKFGFRQWLFRHGCYEDEDQGDRLVFTLNDERRKKTFETLNKEIFPVHGSRMRKAEIPNFPKCQYDIKLLTDESGRAAKLSAELKEEYNRYQELAKTTDTYLRRRQALELLMIPDTVEMVDDLFPQTRVAIFVNFKQTLDELVTELSRKFGQKNIGFVDGSQTGTKGERERQEYVDRFQRNELVAIVCNAQAMGESGSLHDPSGTVERSSLIYPCDSGRRLKQIFGRIHRIEGANCIQYLMYFAGTEQEKTADRVLARIENIELLNDADLIC